MRATPTCVGKMAKSNPLVAFIKAGHPHMRGEDGYSSLLPIAINSGHPHMRGEDINNALKREL